MLYDRRRSLPQESLDLLAAADYIREHGWCQRYAQHPDGRVCLIGAIAMVTQQANVDGWQARKARALKRMQIPGEIFVWNDEPGRTADEVVDMLEMSAWGGHGA